MRAEQQGVTPAQVAALLNPEDLAALERFHETTEDGQDYDVPKERMKRLAELGMVQSHGFGRYSITTIGQYLLGEWTKVPLQTSADSYEAARVALASLKGEHHG